MTSGWERDDDADDDDPRGEGPGVGGGGGRRRHASRMRLGANVVRMPTSGANDDGRALDTFQERRVRGIPRPVAVVVVVVVVAAAGMRPIVVLM